jgi:ABC-type lipoprotein export system ATPase subunit
MSIEVRHIGKRFGSFVALDNVSLDFPSGELTALLGPSGCGKTTLLRLIAGLEQPDHGQVLLDGQDASERHVRERQVGFVFQHYALFRHMSVFDNIAFGLRVKPRKLRPSEAQIREKVMQLLSLVQLDWLADRYPSQLSGGQRQRIALARALAVEPRVLLLGVSRQRRRARHRADRNGFRRDSAICLARSGGWYRRVNGGRVFASRLEVDTCQPPVCDEHYAHCGAAWRFPARIRSGFHTPAGPQGIAERVGRGGQLAQAVLTLSSPRRNYPRN